MSRSVLFVFVLCSLNWASAIFADVGSEDITFILYNSNNPYGMHISIYNTEQQLNWMFKQDKDVKFITHGWMESENSNSVVDIRTAYGRRSDYNVIAVGWTPISKSLYILARLKARGVGDEVGRMVIRLLDSGVTTMDRVHLIGHSLGAHVMGNAGSFVKDYLDDKVARITGLDPAGPGYLLTSEDARLDPGDARFVDIIHTNFGLFGFVSQLGHADFFPNGGVDIQPGCLFSLNIFCSHQRSYQYFTESIYNEKEYPAVHCNSFKNFVMNRCQNGKVTYMGNPTPSSAFGKYYLSTHIPRYIK